MKIPEKIKINNKVIDVQKLIIQEIVEWLMLEHGFANDRNDVVNFSEKLYVALKDNELEFLKEDVGNCGNLPESTPGFFPRTCMWCHDIIESLDDYYTVDGGFKVCGSCFAGIATKDEKEKKFNSYNWRLMFPTACFQCNNVIKNEHELYILDNGTYVCQECFEKE